MMDERCMLQNVCKRYGKCGNCYVHDILEHYDFLADENARLEIELTNLRTYLDLLKESNNEQEEK